MKYRFIEDHKETYRVRSLCAALGVSRSGYYEWRERRPSRRAEDNVRLLGRIQEVHRASRENYGAHKTWKVLRADGELGSVQNLSHIYLAVAPI